MMKMKMIIPFIVICLMALMPEGLSAKDQLTIPYFNISAGESKDLCISLTNDVTYAAFQFDLYLPDGISLISYEADEGRISSGTELTMKQQTDGSYRFMAVAYNKQNIIGQTGSIIKIRVSAAPELANGELSGYFRNIVLSEANATGVSYTEAIFPIFIIAPPVVTVVSVSREYGEKNPTFEFTVEGPELDGEPIIECEATEQSPVGEYPIIIKGSTVKNYNVKYINGTLTITKAPLTINVGDYTVEQGETIPAFVANYSGFKNNETEDVLTKKPEITTIATSDSEPGIYKITINNAEASNYDINYTDGILTIIAGVFKLIYLVDGEVYKTYEVEYGSTIIPEPQPEGNYVRFEWVGVPEKMPAHDVTINADFETGLMSVVSQNDVRYIYSPNGKRVNKLQKGVNIVVMKDGTTRKIKD